MRLAVLLLPGLLAAAVPAAAGDAYALAVRHPDGSSGFFVRGEAVLFDVTVTTSGPETLDHRIYVYRGLDTSGDNVWIVDDGSVTHTSGGTARFTVRWDQMAGGAWIGAGQYTAQYRGPTGTATARFDVEWVPDFALTHLRADATPFGGAPSPQFTVRGCVRNEGAAPAASVPVTLSSRDAVTGWWFPQLTSQVALDGTPCPWVAGGGAAFSMIFVAAAAPGGAALREIRAEANADRAVAELDWADNARATPARWLL